MQNPRHAVELYQNLLASSSYSKEDVLFKIAKNQSLYDPEQAQITYSQITAMKGQRSLDAMENRLFLMFEAGKYEKIVEMQDEWRKGASENNLPLVNLYLGRCYFSLGDYQKALDSLLPHHAHYSQNLSMHKTALMTLVACAAYLHRISDAEKWSDEYQRYFPQDKDTAKILYFQALAYSNGNRFDVAQERFDNIIREIPYYEKIDMVHFEKLLLLYKQNLWHEYRKGFLQFSQEFPSSSQLPGGYYHLIQSDLRMIEELQKKKAPADVLQEQLCKDLILVLKQLDESQKAPYVLHLAKTYYDLKKYQDAIDTLSSFSIRFPNNKYLYQAHFILAACYQEGFQRREDFISHAEKALALNSEFSEANQLRLNLFSFYLQLAKENAHLPDRYELFTEKAAEKLYQAMIQGSPIKKEYLIWLAKNDCVKVKEDATNLHNPIEDPSKKVLIVRATKTLENLFKIDSDEIRLKNDTSLLSLEPELIELSSLYGWQGEQKKQLSLLSSLVTLQEEHTDWKWNSRPQALFALGKAYEVLSQPSKALECYSQLLSMQKASDSYWQSASKLNYARLAFELLSPEKKNIQDPEMQTILNYLKDLQIRKKISQEPLHLEAAIDYAFMRASLENRERQDSQILQLLIRAKEDFTSKEGIWAKDYESSRKRDPEKDRIYQAYLMLMDAHIAKFEAKKAEKEGKLFEKEQKEDAAKALYKSLLQGDFAVTQYVMDQAKSGLEQPKM